MVASPRTVSHLSQFSENPRTLTDIFTTRHITPNIRSSLLPKLYSAGLTLTSHIKHRSTVNYRTYVVVRQYLATKWVSYQNQPLSQNTQYNHSTSIPYIQGTSEKVSRVLNEAGVKVVMKPFYTIGRILPSPKDPLTLEKKSCLVYQVHCFECNFVYIGQTKRDFKSRLAEHKLAIKNQEPEKSALREHSMQFDHKIDWKNSKVLKRGSLFKMTHF